ncbi:MAG: XRE family transcriptional regulator [Clostridia bacterium]|nr:XRE family transcriptional regulator [Clostridia bacterium]
MFNRQKFKAAMVASGKNAADVAKMLGINESTFYRKIANDGNFNRAEIEQMVSYLSIEKPIDIFFGEKLA